jgi:hypothetical protein
VEIQLMSIPFHSEIWTFVSQVCYQFPIVWGLYF